MWGRVVVYFSLVVLGVELLDPTTSFVRVGHERKSPPLFETSSKNEKSNFQQAKTTVETDSHLNLVTIVHAAVPLYLFVFAPLEFVQVLEPRLSFSPPTNIPYLLERPPTA